MQINVKPDAGDTVPEHDYQRVVECAIVGVRIAEDGSRIPFRCNIINDKYFLAGLLEGSKHMVLDWNPPAPRIEVPHNGAVNKSPRDMGR